MPEDNFEIKRGRRQEEFSSLDKVGLPGDRVLLLVECAGRR